MKPSEFCNSDTEICEEVVNLEPSLLVQMELIRKIAWLNSRGIKSQTCMSITSLILLRSSVGKRVSRPRYVPVQAFLRTPCCGSKHWRWSNQWTTSGRRSQLEGTSSRFFDMLAANIASALKKIMTNPYFKKRVNLEEQKAQMQD